MVIAAVCQPLAARPPNSDVEGLRVEFAREALDLIRVHDELRAREVLSDAQVV